LRISTRTMTVSTRPAPVPCGTNCARCIPTSCLSEGEAGARSAARFPSSLSEGLIVPETHLASPRSEWRWPEAFHRYLPGRTRQIRPLCERDPKFLNGTRHLTRDRL
jgi:hypothetical protein